VGWLPCLAAVLPQKITIALYNKAFDVSERNGRLDAGRISGPPQLGLTSEFSQSFSFLCMALLDFSFIFLLCPAALKALFRLFLDTKAGREIDADRPRYPVCCRDSGWTQKEKTRLVLAILYLITKLGTHMHREWVCLFISCGFFLAMWFHGQLDICT
jgi:hypothetical protein